MKTNRFNIKEACAYSSFFFNVGARIDLDKVNEKLGLEEITRSLSAGRAQPQKISLSETPMVLTLPVSDLEVSGSSCTSAELVLHGMGVAVFSLKFPFKGNVTDVIQLSKNLYHNEEVEQWIKNWLKSNFKKMKGAIENPKLGFKDAYRYTCYCVEDFEAGTSVQNVEERYPDELAKWLRATDEILSSEEVEDALSSRGSYTENDFAIIDHDAALLVQGPNQALRLLIETSLVQVLQYKWISTDLDRVIQRGISFLRRPTSHIPFSPISPAELRELDPYTGVLTDQMTRAENLITLMGGRYLQRISDLLYDKFTLGDWYKELEEKVEYLGHIYQHLYEMVAMKSTEKLEWMIVILIFVSLWASFFH